MSAAALPLIISGTLLQVGAQAQGLEAQEEAAGFNQARARENARIVRIESRKKAKQAVKAGAELKSTQRAAFGKAGVLLAGSPEEVLAETERVTREDVEAILMAGDIGSREALSQAEQFGREGRAARRARSIAPLATLVSGFGAAASTRTPGGTA